MDAAIEGDDDLLFSDLSRQIALMILEDEQEDEKFAGWRPTRSFQDSDLRPSFTSDVNKGTGVFIPLSSLPRWKRQFGRRRRPAKAKETAAPATADKLSDCRKRSNARQKRGLLGHGEQLK